MTPECPTFILPGRLWGILARYWKPHAQQWAPGPDGLYRIPWATLGPPERWALYRALVRATARARDLEDRRRLAEQLAKLAGVVSR